MNKILNSINDRIYLDRVSLVLLILAIIGNLFLWYFRIYKVNFGETTIFYCTGVLVINILLSITFSRKDNLIPYFLLGSALLVQILIIILIKYSVFIGY